MEVYISKLKQSLRSGIYPLMVIDKFNTIPSDNTYRIHGENMEKITFEIFKNNHIIPEKILETDNFIFYITLS